MYGVFTSIVSGIAYYREKTAISSLADQYIEVVRDMPYSQIGTKEGNPSGLLPDLPNANNLTINGTAYQVYYAVSYVDDPADGTILAGTDPAPNDYKQIKLYIKNVSTGATHSFLTNVAPKGLEGLASGGALSLKVFDASGQPVPGAVIHIKNTNVVPNIDLIRTADANGNWVEVGLPDSANSYHVTASKTGYSIDQTYPISSQNPSPTKPDATISNGQVTQVSFSIDRLSNLVFNTLNQICAPVPGVGLDVRGSKLIGTPNVLKFDNTYTSNSNGRVSLNNIGWDNYTPSLTGSSYMIYGSFPIQQVSILPGSDQNFNLMIGPKTDNSLLVIVKDASTSNPIEGAKVDLQAPVPPTSYTVTSVANANGTIAPAGAIPVNSGYDRTFNITPNSGYVIQNVSVDGTYIGAVSSYTFSNVMRDHAIAASFVPSVSWLPGWSYRKKITISNANVDSDLANFPALVKITADSNMSSALANGYDVRFTDSNGTALLQYERESWSGGAGGAVTANFWVKVPTISHGAATNIYIYYGNSAANTDWTAQGSPTNAQSVWDSNYLGVWHLPNGTTLTAGDSTAAGNSGTANNVAASAGQTDGAASYSSSSSYRNIAINNPSSVLRNLGNSDYTFEAWVKPGSIVQSSYVSYMNGEGLVETKNSKYGIVHSRNVVAASSANIATGSFAQLVGTKNGSSYNVYINDVISNGTFSNDNGYDNNYYSIGGGYQAKTANEFLGSLDEVRISNYVRPNNWIKFEYHNITDSGNDLFFANQETKANSHTITAAPTANGTITPSGAVLVNNGDNQTFIITPSFGYHISNINVDGNSVGTTSPYVFNNITADHTISATFDPTIITGGYIASGFTSGSIWSQQNWSGGPGQSDFSDSAKYYQDDGNISNNNIPSGLRLADIGNSYVSSGSLTSSAFDTGTNSTSYTTLTWQPTSQDPATSIKFQIAVNNDDLTWDYLGPDGTSQTYYTVPGTTINNANNNRYIRYKVFLSTTDASKTPVLTSANINYVSGCSAPGQAMFPGLEKNPAYQATISIDGYQTQTISNLNVDGYNVLQVSLSH